MKAKAATLGVDVILSYDGGVADAQPSDNGLNPSRV